MKLYLDGILVVEGKEDASYLSNYIDSEIVVVNGFEMADETIKYLSGKRVIALLDPDEAGQKIRKTLNTKLDDVINVEIDITKCVRGIKNGVAECSIEEIVAKLQTYSVKNPAKLQRIQESDLFELGLINGDSALRNFVCRKLNLGKCNGKALYKRLNANNISIEQLTQVVEEYKHGN